MMQQASLGRLFSLKGSLSMNSKRVRVWDLPTRLFHWLLAASVAAALATGEVGGNWIDWHGRLGILAVGLLAFRLVWGVAGSTYARFATFLPSAESVFAYLKGEWKGLGHNPLGAISVLVILGVLLLQVATGLFANDDIAFRGPLFSLVGKALSDRLTGIHHLAGSLVFLVVGVHLAAIVFYVRVKKDNLVKPMITGWKDDAEGASATGGGIVALVVALAVAAAAVYGASGAWLPEPPPPPPAAETPNW